MTQQEIFDTYDQHILSTYTRLPAIMVKGKGSVLTDIHGKKYLDLFPGWGVSNLGHCHPKVMGGVRDQIGKLIHVPNNLYNPFQAKLARELVRIAFPSKMFFCNSGAEAAETAIKFARAYGEGKRFEIISHLNSFHGRTSGALAATGQVKYHDSFAPLPGGFKHVVFNDIGAFKAAVTERTVAVMLEFIQGEGGIHVASKDYVQAVRRICDEKKILFIADEVQTGMGRTGEMFCYQHYGITPDLMCLAKALGGGLPIGVLLVRQDIAGVFKPGMHGSTFAGSPLVCKAALGVIKAMHSEKVLANVRSVGPYLVRELEELKAKHGIIKEVRGLGLMIGVELTIDGQGVFKECFNRGLIINCTQTHVLRIMPALNVTKRQIDKAVHILDACLSAVTDKQKVAA